MKDKPLKVAVVIASLGRPGSLADMVEMLGRQTLQPSHIVFSVTSEADLPDAQYLKDVDVLVGPKGLPTQRNRGMEQVLDKADVIAFFDDDYIGSRFALERIAATFEACPDVIGMTGHLLADGIHGPGISSPDALDLIRQYDEKHPTSPKLEMTETFGLYGCNLAYRASAIGDVRFDSTLPLYAWQEDVDFAQALHQRGGGRIVRTNAFAGVHRGEKGGRTSGVKLGYSQIANPVYLMRKGTMSGQFGRRLMWRNFVANHVKALRPEPWVDRWGRVRGNWIGIHHYFARKLRPERALEL